MEFPQAKLIKGIIMKFSSITFKNSLAKLLLLSSFSVLSFPAFSISSNDAIEAAKQQLEKAEENVQSCIKTLDKAGHNPLLDSFLTSLNPNTTKSKIDKEKAFKTLQTLVGKPLSINPSQLEMCLQVLGSQLQLTAANKQSAVAFVGSNSLVACAAGMNSCPNPTGPGNICCTSDDVCASACGPEGGNCYAYCEHKLCFPSDAIVQLEDGSSKLMSQVEIGDRVQVVMADGSMAYEDVYLMTHNDFDTETAYLKVLLESGKVMTLSPRHFIPTAQGTEVDWQTRVVKGANELQAGDIVWHQESNGEMYASVVSSLQNVIAKGAFNPLTATGTIVVDSVVASAHSEWFLDGIFSADTQAKVYQAMFMPVRGIYNFIGAENMTTVTQEWGLVDFIREATETPVKLALSLVLLTLVLIALAMVLLGIVSVVRKILFVKKGQEVIVTQ